MISEIKYVSLKSVYMYTYDYQMLHQNAKMLKYRYLTMRGILV